MSKSTFRIFLLAAALALPSVCRAEVVRPAPDFVWLSSGAKGKSLKSLRGQPVVLIVAESPRQRIFRAQVGQLKKVYQLLGNDKMVAVAAFTRELGVIRSNIPFALAADPASVSSLYGVQGNFAVFVIGKDGNIDALSDRVLPGQRIIDIINNSFVVQRDNRKSE
jgi:peroxiredoxin